MNITIQKLTEMSALSIYEMYKLRVDVFVVEQKCAYPEIDDLDKECLHLQIFLEDKLAAYCRIISEGETARIGRVIVHPSFRKQQLGKQLMAVAMDTIKRSKHYKWIELSAQSHLQNFYGFFGFHAISEEYIEDKIPHIDMKVHIQ